MGTKVALLYNLKSSVEQEENEPPDLWAELDSETTVHAIGEALTAVGHDVVYIEGNHQALCRLANDKTDVAFNICEGFCGRNREAHIPAILEMLGIPYAGSDVLTLALCLDKPMTKRVLAQSGIPTARFAVYHDAAEVVDAPLPFPLFVKPAHEGSSKGISSQSKVHSLHELRQQVDSVCTIYKQPALVEEFLPGREFTVGVLGNRHPFVFAPMEISYDHVPQEFNGIYSYEYKKNWVERHNFICPAPISKDEAQRLQAVALAAYQAVGCRDFGRVDLRMDAHGNPYVIEINPLPGMAPGYSDYPVAAEANGIAYRDLVAHILALAMERYGLYGRSRVVLFPEMARQVPLTVGTAVGSGQ